MNAVVESLCVVAFRDIRSVTCEGGTIAGADLVLAFRNRGGSIEAVLNIERTILPSHETATAGGAVGLACGHHAVEEAVADVECAGYLTCESTVGAVVAIVVDDGAVDFDT